MQQNLEISRMEERPLFLSNGRPSYWLLLNISTKNMHDCYKSTLRKFGDNAVFGWIEVGADDAATAGVDPVDETLVCKHVDADRRLSVGRHSDTSYDRQLVATTVGSRQLVDLLVVRVREQQKRARRQV